MALLTEHSDTNKVTHVGLSIRYRTELASSNNSLRVVTRYATKTYSYVGMTYAAARDCADAKAAQYLRSHPSSYIIETDQETGIAWITPICVTDTLCLISMVHGEGDSWDVNISVAEKDVRATDTAQSPELLFATENTWDYDESDEGGANTIKILSARADAGSSQISVTYSSKNPLTTPLNMTAWVQYSTGYSFTMKASLASGSNVIFVNSDYVIAAGSYVVRILYQNIKSNIYSFTVS